MRSAKVANRNSFYDFPSKFFEENSCFVVIVNYPGVKSTSCDFTFAVDFLRSETVIVLKSDSLPKLQMAKNSRMILILCLVIASAFLPGSADNPMETALKSVHCVARGYTFTVKVAGCQERSVTINTCLGTCLSLSTPTGANYEQVISCTCCQQIKTQKVDVGLWCQDKADPSKLVKYYHPIETVTECACASC